MKIQRKSSKRLFTDFDGPLIDVSERYYQVYIFCLYQVRLPQQPIVAMSKAEFWSAKRAQIPEWKIGWESGLTLPGQTEEFAELRRLTVHSESYFKYDRLHDFAIGALERLQAHSFDLAVMTMRRQKELFPVLEQFNLKRFFAPDRIFCLSNDYCKTGDTRDKPKLMEKAIATLPIADQQWIVGDTEADIIAGKRYRVTTIGILSGIRNEYQLALHHPSAIKNNLAEVVDLLVQTTS
ncbi:MAG: haloacid dehalogenase [Cyanobacteria bacterium M5B4]|nr:HAD family hydrolase [Cyanobacteria bacterium KgW148]PLS69642.1 MAG: haloacid dehalogenase [Cyanobacteria bacterium M5B4]